jgi:LuxR family maltose regulon positive regulatory protein
LWSLAPRYAGDGRAGLLGAWLEPFRERELTAYPELALTAVTYHLAEGRRDHAERALDTAERRLPAQAPAVAMLRACIARHGAGRMGEDAARACALVPPDSPWQSLGLLLQGVSRHLAGERDAAGVLLEAGEHRATGRGPVVSALCRAQLALLAVEAGEWEEAERHAERAALAGAAPSAARALVLAVSAVVAAQRGDLAHARQDAAEGRRLLASRDEFTPWLVAETQAWLARAMIRLSDGPAARRLLSRAARVQVQVLDAPVLLAWVHEGWELADAFAESATGDGPTLTNAELRILRLLPSHLTLREIGERLHVSTNTVKTQAMAIYRKLDVSSRSDAVARGRAAGLIDGV